MLTMQADLAYDEGALDEALERIARDHPKVYARVLQANGPGGGWPFIEWATTDRAAMDAFVAWYAGDDARQIAEMQDWIVAR
jgi:hypothetical protein